MNNKNSNRMEADEIRNKQIRKGLFTKLIRYLKPYILHMSVSLFLLLCLTAIELYMPLITKQAVDEHIITNKKVIIFDDKNEFDNFDVDNKKFVKYQHDNKFFVVFPLQKEKVLKKEMIKKFKANNQLIDDTYIIIQITDENKSILETGKFLKISDFEILLTTKQLESFSKDEIVLVRANSISKLQYLGLIFLILVILQFLTTFFQIYITNYASQHAMYNLRNDIFKHMQKLPMKFFDTNPVGRLVTRVANDVTTLDQLLSSGLLKVIQDSLTIIGIMIIMFIISWKLALVSFSIVPFVLILTWYFKNKLAVIYRKLRKRLAALNAMISEHISGVSLIQIFNQQNSKGMEFEKINQKHFSVAMEQIKLFALFRPMIGIARQISFALILWYGGFRILNNTLSLGIFIAFTSYMERFFQPLRGISEQFNVFQSAMAGAERVFDLLEMKEENYNSKESENIGFKGDIEFKNVSLAYFDDDYVLKDISFKVKAGEKVALVGHTGSGKTSIVRLLMGFYPYQKGEILIDGKNIKDYSLDDIRNNIGIVQQDVFMFTGTIKDNIALNKSDKITDDELQKVARYVNVHKFIDSLPGKFNEPVMERGATFSFGQRQLIAFARVLAYNPSIFILDEATSNIDTETEELIQGALENITENRTSIMIAHRLSTIQKCDKIIVLNKGKIIEEGSHQELLQNEGLYYDLYRLQYK